MASISLYEYVSLLSSNCRAHILDRHIRMASLGSPLRRPNQWRDSPPRCHSRCGPCSWNNTVQRQYSQEMEVQETVKTCLGGVVDAALAVGAAQRGRLAPIDGVAHHHVDCCSADAPPVLLRSRRRRLQDLYHPLACMCTSPLSGHNSVSNTLAPHLSCIHARTTMMIVAVLMRRRCSSAAAPAASRIFCHALV